MSYTLTKECSEKERIDFFIEYNQKKGLKIEETETAWYALEANEIMQDGVPVINPKYEEEQAQKEAKRIAMLHITKADMERALVRAFYITFNDILEKTKVEQPDTWKFVEAELNAGWIYRGNDYVISFASKLGITPKQLDDFFIAATSPDQETKINAWKILVPKKGK